ncbi:MAG: hypothetical protein GY941_21065 [Planctomycetes bacterium]|nr:hypothetical protein [Planctomycetota bacterium]
MAQLTIMSQYDDVTIHQDGSFSGDMQEAYDILETLVGPVDGNINANFYSVAEGEMDYYSIYIQNTLS